MATRGNCDIDNNPLLSGWESPFGVPPFKKARAEHFTPAIKEAIRRARKEIDSIVKNSEPPTFRNSVEALERSGELLNRITSLLFNLNSAETDPDIQAAAMECAALVTEYSNDITLNRQLFSKIEHVYKGREYTIYPPEQKMLLEKSYRAFIKGGAGLADEKRERYRAISNELSSLTLKFEENLLAETNELYLHITSLTDLEGLPQSVRDSAATEAQARGLDGWVITLHAPSYIPFMQYSGRRDLREKLYRLYSTRAFRENERDNREVVCRIVSLRLELANLLGYEDYSSFILEDRMAGSSERVTGFLRQLLGVSMPAAMRDFGKVTSFASTRGHSGDIMRWDWAYYSESLKKSLYNIDDEALRPYFRLEAAEEAILGLASRLFGLTFTPCNDITMYHPSVKCFRVTENGRDQALLMLDYFPRQGKSGGAWMTTYRNQSVIDGEDIRPVVSLVMNFPAPDSKGESLLTHNDLKTFLHEFGHALHAMLSQCTYDSLAGTNVERDFVELPSQLMENYAYEPEWLRSWAVHNVTGERIPDHIPELLRQVAIFNAGYACLRQLSFALLDMAWHTIKEEIPVSISTFERNSMMATELFPPVEGTNMSVAFSHLFAGGYAAGYYGYKWAEVLEADVWELFRRRGVFDLQTAKAFREKILERGGTEKPAELYRLFMGREPSIEPFMRKSGFQNN